MLQIFLSKLNRRWSRIPVIYRGGLILAIPAICIIAILVTWTELRKDAIVVHREIDRTESNIIEANNLLLLLSNAEMGVRGYAIANKDYFLRPYQQAVISLPNTLEELQDSQGDVQKQIQEITKLVEQELNLLAQTLNNIQNSNTSEVNNLLVQSEQTNSKVAKITNDFRVSQREILANHYQQLFHIRDVTNLALWYGAIVSLLSFLAALYLFHLLERELNDRQKSLRSRAKELAKLNQTLATTNATLAERNLELDRFSHIVSHDLKAPLRGISNLSEWIEEDLADKLTEDTQNYLHLQRERIGRMEDLINGLLEYARAGKQQVASEIVDVKQLLEQVIDSIDPPANFTLTIKDKMPIMTTQRLFLEQVFSNLIGNGIKHHPRLDGKITISAIEYERFYEFSVADDGVGIPAMLQSKIFDIFHTLKTEKERNNTGIGLAIVKKIVEERGGKITVESEVGKGATFCFQWIR